MDVKIEDIYD